MPSLRQITTALFLIISNKMPTQAHKIHVNCNDTCMMFVIKVTAKQCSNLKGSWPPN